MKKFYLLVILLICGFGFAQGTQYVIKISNLSYSINRGVKNNTSSNIRISVRFKDGTKSDLYYRDIRNNGDKEVNLDVASIVRSSKPVAIDCYAFVNFRSGSDANGTISRNVDMFCPSGSFSGNYSPRMSNITFNYKIEPKFYITRTGDDILPTHAKKTMTATPGYDLHYYRWQYTLIPNATATQWIDLPLYNNSPSLNVDAVDILGANTGLNIGKNIYFRIKPCIETPGISTLIQYSIRASAPKVLSFEPSQPKCTDENNGAVKLVFNRGLFDGEKLNYTLIDADTGTPANYNGELAIGSDMTVTLNNLRGGKYTLQLIGFKDGLNTAINEDVFDLTTFSIIPPPPVNFTLDKTDVVCNGAEDGTITISPTGGTRDATGNDSYSINNGPWMPFPNNKPYVLTGVKPGIYKIRVRDMNKCVAREQSLLNGKIVLGEEIVQEKEIEQPDPLTVDFEDPVHPTFFNAKNGKLTAIVKGGTIDGNKYWYEWKHSDGTQYPTTTQYDAVNKTYTITLTGAPAGEYKLTVRDKNYNAATVKTGCTIIEAKQVLTEPEKIEIELKIEQPISCNSESLNPVGGENKAKDGILKATVKGGITFKGTENGGLPYKFFWSKYNTVTGEWDLLADYKTDTADGLSEGKYSLNVEDANKIVQGIYNAIELETATPEIQDISEPKKIEISFSSGNVSCHDGNNGWVNAAVIGGTGSYTYKWYNTGDGVVDKNKISSLIAGTYTVEVTDKNGCFATADIEITEPGAPVAIEYAEIFTPTFSGATNGRIVAKITGGTANSVDHSYAYEWRNAAGDLKNATAQLVDGVFTITLKDLPAETYFLTIKDANYNEAANQIINCSILKSEVKLTEPDPLKIVFEIIQSISCNVSNEFGSDTDTTPNDGQRDESQDGILKAHVTGGIPLASSVNNGLPYHFYWKKQQADGTWLALPNIKGETALNLSHGNYALNVEDRNGIRLGTYVNNQLTQEIDAVQLMQEPPKLSVTITKGNVFCNGGNDGWAEAHVVGGTSPYEYKWSNGVEIAKNTVLKAGTYSVLITDHKGCTTFESIEIKEPDAPLTINYKEVLNPSFYKATNGKIVVEVKGGTIAADNTYWFEWKNSKGVVQTTTTTSFANNIYTISLNGLGEEIYTLTVRDANYDAATNKASCTVANSVTALDDPDPLEVTFEVIRTISCNVSNEFGNETDAKPLDNQRDESQDGILKAHVKGGIQLPANKNNGLPYYYTWKKKQKDGTWTLWNNIGDTAEYLSEGTYALNIEDANGIKLGTYVNNVLVEEKDAEKYVPQPDRLSLTFTKFDVGCTTGDDGWAEAHVTGGTPPYTYQWTNGETTSKIENITANNYFVMVTDDKGCVVQGSIFVGDPNGIFTTETIKDPICYQGNDGSIELNVTGGNFPYTYLWNTGAVTKDLKNLTAGNYEVTITCPDCCVYKKRFVLKDPQPVIVNIGSDRTLCSEQNLDLDASIADPNAKYNWTSTNGFTSNEAKVNVSKAGTYHVKVTSGLGCIGEDEIVIKTSQAAISSEFLLSSQAYLDEEVILVNTSNPFGESTDWVIPKGVKIVEQKEKFITLKFDAIGVYSIGLQQTQGECYAVYTKNVTVEERGTLPNTGTTSQFIIDFIVTPSPSNGNFKAIVNLENNSAINLRLFSSSGQNTMIQKQESGKKKYEVDFNTSLSSGIYVLVLETGQQTLVKKIIIN